MNGSQKSFLAPTIFFFCLLLSLAIWLGARSHTPPLWNALWADALVPILALAATLTAAASGLPVQNVIFSAALIALISGIVEIIAAKAGVPFGPFVYTDNLGPRLFGILPWPVPIIWIVAVLNSRGTARLILRPWRSTPNYGYWSIGLTCLLTVLFDANLEPLATRVSHFWLWETSPNVPAWYGAPWVNFAGWGAVTLLIVGIATPWLVNKKPDANPPPDPWPAATWLLLVAAMAIGAAGAGLWGAFGFGLMTCLLVGVAARQNSRR